MKRFVFLDFETTGLDEQTCAPIEVAVVVTDERLNELGCFERLISPRPGCAWDVSAHDMHVRSGLLEEIKQRRSYGRLTASARLFAFLVPFTGPYIVLHLAGNSVHFDRRFLKRYFSETEALFHHRHLDVSSIRMLAESAGRPNPPSANAHRAMADVRESLEDARRFLGVLRCL